MRRIAVFFYGLFMDVELLRAKGTEPANVRRGSVRGFSLRIGARATLVPDAAGLAHGLVMDLTHAEIDRLYADPSVSMYRPEAVVIESDDGSAAAALCFNLIETPRDVERNAAYAEKLRHLAERIGLPAHYISRI